MSRAAGAADAALIAALTLLYATSFGPQSPLYTSEPFDQDSAFLVHALAEGSAYPWNPQNHLLYHAFVESAYAGWSRLFGRSPESAFHLLRLVTVATGLVCLVGLRQLFGALGVAGARRTLLLASSGLSVAAWFHFSVFETHVLALPFLLLHCRAVWRLGSPHPRGPLERALLVVALVGCGLVRVDLWRLSLLSVALPALPGARRHARGLLEELAWVAVLGLLLQTLLAAWQLDLPLGEAVLAPFSRADRPELASLLARPENLSPSGLFTLLRASSLYGYLMPVAAPGLADPDWFSLPIAGLRSAPAAWPAFAGVAAWLAATALFTARRLRSGDPLAWMLPIQGTAGLLLYTYFNPWEPFLWVLELWIGWVVASAWVARALPERAVPGLALLAGAVGLHNALAFWLAFR